MILPTASYTVKVRHQLWPRLQEGGPSQFSECRCCLCCSQTDGRSPSCSGQLLQSTGLGLPALLKTSALITLNRPAERLAGILADRWEVKPHAWHARSGPREEEEGEQAEEDKINVAVWIHLRARYNPFVCINNIKWAGWKTVKAMIIQIRVDWLRSSGWGWSLGRLWMVIKWPCCWEAVP